MASENWSLSQINNSAASYKLGKISVKLNKESPHRKKRTAEKSLSISFFFFIALPLPDIMVVRRVFREPVFKIRIRCSLRDKFLHDIFSVIFERENFGELKGRTVRCLIAVYNLHFPSLHPIDLIILTTGKPPMINGSHGSVNSGYHRERHSR